MKILLACLALVAAAPAFAADHVVVQQGRTFHPGELTIRKGDTLTFTNNDEFIHQMYSSDLFDSDERVPGQTLTQAFTQTGTFEVHCHIHPKMKLFVHVN
jgi:plastocyanin